MARQTCESFGASHSGTSQVEVLRDVDHLREIYARTSRKSQRQDITFRGGGHSFDGQAVHHGDTGQHLILLTDNFNTIKVDTASATVTVGAAAKWKDILTECREYGFIPPIMQTGQDATAGGTLAGDCLSRFSIVLGKESESIESFTLVTPAQGAVPCSRTQNDDLFHAAIGGHGYLGLATNITYRLCRLPAGSVAHTEAMACDTLEKILEAQMTATRSAIRRAGRARKRDGITSVLPPQLDDQYRAVSSAIFMSPLQLTVKPRGAVFQSWYAPPAVPALPHFPLHDDIDGEMRYISEVAARERVLNWLIHEAMYQTIKLGRNRFDDDLHPFTFFMDGTTIARRKYKERTGKPMPLVQQTFVVERDAALEFATTCARAVRPLHPTAFDILFVKGDDSWMSANYHKSGFAISVAFGNYDRDKAPADPPRDVVRTLRALSEKCLKAKGRVHLVKNVFADKDTMRAMFSEANGGRLEHFEKLKAEVDPGCLLRNPFAMKKIFNFAGPRSRARRKR